MQLKYTWSQKTPIGGTQVALPTSISHRLEEEGSKHAWPVLMKEVEDVGHNLAELISAVAEKNTELTEAERAREAMKWRFQLEVALMRKIVAAQ